MSLQLPDIINTFLNTELANILFLIIGFVLLTVAADWLVDGASNLAKRFKMSDLVIGLTVVAMGTSMPELVVNLTSAFNHETDLAITNVLGSNIANILLILGCTACVCPVLCNKQTIFEVLICIVSAALTLIFSFGSDISNIEGIILCVCFILFIIYTLKKGKQETHNEPDNTEHRTVIMPIGKTLFLILIGLGGLALGGQLTVNSAVDIATRHHIPEAIIGVTIVAIGTSLPELATSIIAATKGHTELAIGNIVGSNIFNTLFVLGITSSIFPLPTYEHLLRDVIVALGATILLLLFIINNKNHKVSRLEGIIFVLIYIGYIIVLVNEALHSQ
ncbi:MAG: calcium/sodium antiporter [Bacteroidales bacterium]|nr:calcium/sodium antiporter [Bacteroidales bacterium]